MRILHSMDEFDGDCCVAALGTFDGVHLGHQKLIGTAVALAREYGTCSAALTFDRHPLSLVWPQGAPTPLTSPEERAALLEELGLDILIEQPFTRAFAAQAPEEYIGRIMRLLKPRAIVAGFNHRFGRNGGGDAETIRRLCEGTPCRAVIVEPVLLDGEVVSSSRIRALVERGETDRAEALLGHRLRFRD